MQNKRSSMIRALSFTSNAATSQATYKTIQRSKTLGDKTTMAVYYENILLPKQVTHSFYATWLHCYEELFEASLSSKSSHFKFECSEHVARKDSEKLTAEKASLFEISIDCDVLGRYTQTEVIREDEAEQGSKIKETGSFPVAVQYSSSPTSRSMYSPGRFFNSKKKSYRFDYSGDM